MCGLVGMAGDINGTHEKLFKQLLVIDSLRGEDSTGILGVRKHDEEEYILAKQLGNPFEVLDTSASKKIFSGSSRILLGHNRFATQGKVNKSNAHPFEFDTLVGAHNGTLTNKWKLADSARFDVDSENLYHHIEKHGLEDALRLAEGAFALTWWDKIDNTINFIRNNERPLWWTLIGGKVLAWASEADFLELVLNRIGEKHTEPEQFEVGMLHSIKVNKGGALDKPIVRPIELAPKKEPVIYQHNVRVVGHGNSQGSNSGQSNGGSNSTGSNDRVFTAPGGQAAGTSSVGIKPDVRFMQAKEELFEAVCIVDDQRTGADYVLCFNPTNPHLEVRLYRHTGCDKVFNDIGCEFTADVSGFIALSSQGKGYYKISPHSIKIVAHGHHHKNKAGQEELFPDHHGVDISRKEWEKKYGICSFCTVSVEPEALDEGARFTASGYCFCKGCAEDPEVQQFTTFI